MSSVIRHTQPLDRFPPKNTRLHSEKKTIMSVHSGVTCDKSGQSPIIGARYKHMCKNCDLCQAEFDQLSSNDRAKFVKIMNPLSEHIVEFEYEDKGWNALTHKPLICKLQTLVDKTATEVQYSRYGEKYTSRLVHAAGDHEIIQTNVNTGKTRKLRMPALHIGTCNSVCEEREAQRTEAAECECDEAAATEPEDEIIAHDNPSGDADNVLVNPTPKQVKSMTLRALKSAAFSLGLPTYGSKGDIIGKIRCHDKGNGILANLIDAGATSSAATVTHPPIAIPPIDAGGPDLTSSAATITHPPIATPSFSGTHAPAVTHLSSSSTSASTSSVDAIELYVKKIKAAEAIGDTEMVQRLKRKLEDY